MQQTLKKIFTHWKVVLLLVFLLFAVVAMRPQLLGNEGVAIRRVLPNSSASIAGIENPSGRLAPVARERVLSVNGIPVNSVAEYYQQIDGLYVLKQTKQYALC